MDKDAMLKFSIERDSSKKVYNKCTNKVQIVLNLMWGVARIVNIGMGCKSAALHMVTK